MTTTIRYRYACGCGRTVVEPSATPTAGRDMHVVNVGADCANCKGRPAPVVQPGGSHFNDGTGATRVGRDSRGNLYAVAHDQHGRRHFPHFDDPAHSDWRLA